MRTTIAVCAILAGVAATSTGQQSRSIRPVTSQQRRALIIGNRDYRANPLKNTINDANDMAAALRNVGFHVTLATNLSRSGLLDATNSMIQSIAPGDIAFFYYSGHGFQLDGENYLVPIEFAASTRTGARAGAVPFGPIKSSLERSPAQLTIMVLDACRNNEITPDAEGLSRYEAGLGAYIAFAASPGQTASDNPAGQNGLFTEYLLKALQAPMNISDLFRQVRQQVYAASGNKQLPYLHDQVIGDFFLKRAPASAPAAGPAAEIANATPADALLEEGKELYHQHRCKEAQQKLDQAARRAPTNAYVQLALGLSYTCQTLWRPAADHFSRAIELKPNYAAAYWNRGQVFAQNAQFELAIEDFDWALEQEPENASLYWRRGMAKFGLMHYEDARKDFAESIAHDPSSPNGYHWRGRVLYQLGNFREALADFEAAIARKQDFAEAIQYRNRTRERLDRSR